MRFSLVGTANATSRTKSPSGSILPRTFSSSNQQLSTGTMFSASGSIQITRNTVCMTLISKLSVNAVNRSICLSVQFFYLSFLLLHPSATQLMVLFGPVGSPATFCHQHWFGPVTEISCVHCATSSTLGITMLSWHGDRCCDQFESIATIDIISFNWLEPMPPKHGSVAIERLHASDLIP